MKKKIILPIIAVVVLAGGLALASPFVARLIVKGGINYMNKKEEQEKEELVKIIDSEIVQKQIKEEIDYYNTDFSTDTEKLIQSYKVDYDSAKFDPMGGMGFKLILNNDKDQYVTLTFTLDNQGKVEQNGSVLSAKFSKMIDKNSKTEGGLNE